MKTYDEALQGLDPEFREILDKIPKADQPRLPSDWLHWQIIERYTILKYADIREGQNILEIGCGSHAIATIPLAHLVGETGRVVAVDIGRWKGFWERMRQTGLSRRVIPLQDDARKLPFPFPCFDLVVCIHGMRSFDSKKSILQSIKEMLRVTEKEFFIVESSPIAKNKAQEAHLAMYNLRNPTFKALGHPEYGDIPYFMPEELAEIVREGGASNVDMKLIDVNMPHHLAYFPLDEIKKIRDRTVQEDLEKKWIEALEMLDKYGEEHPPAIVITCSK